MSHHGHGYRIYPDDSNNPKVSHEQWVKADTWINGLSFKKDFNEAVAIAKLGVRSCGTPFVVMEIPLGGIRPEMCNIWLID